MYCRKCGKEINDEAYVCIYCGAKAHETPEEKPANTGYAGAGYASYGSNNTQPPVTYKKTNGMAIAGFVCAFLFPLLGLIFSIIGMKQCEERGDDGYGLAKAGKIISIVFMVLSFVLGIIYGVAIAAIIGGGTTY